ncbi:MAG: hypothetical protein IJ113_03930, partial [Eggerthellaceae bacterium]|nr:hypothetical protein [Eggerthellaceae bacterium]
MASRKSFTQKLRVLFSVLLIANLLIPSSAIAFADEGAQSAAPDAAQAENANSAAGQDAASSEAGDASSNANSSASSKADSQAAQGAKDTAEVKDGAAEGAGSSQESSAAKASSDAKTSSDVKDADATDAEAKDANAQDAGDAKDADTKSSSTKDIEAKDSSSKNASSSTSSSSKDSSSAKSPNGSKDTSTANSKKSTLKSPTLKSASDENMQVGVTVAGSANGPYDITITAKQLTASDPQWGDETTLYFIVNNIVKLPEASAITANDDSAQITRNNEYSLTVKGYNFSANVDTPLIITITGATLNTAAGTLDNVNGSASLDLLSSTSTQTYIWRNGHDYVFVNDFTDDTKPTVPVVWYGGSGPKPTWNGKKASWQAADSATSYDVQLIGPGNEKLVDTNTTALEQDFSSYITKDGRYRVNVWAKYGTDVKSATPGFADKTWYEVKVAPAFKDIGENYYEAGTTGGTVAGTATSGDTFTTGENGAISGLFAVGDTITITPTAAEGYTFEKFQSYFDGSSYVEKTDNPLEFTLEYPQIGLAAFFVQDEPDPVTVILEVGEGHEALARKISDAAEAEGYEPTLSGTTLTMAKFPVLDETGKTVTVQDGANDVIYELVRTAFGPGSGYWRDNGEELIDTALKTIENYDSEQDIYDELDEATDAIADNQKYYMLWAKPATKATLTIEKPICGTEVTQDPYEGIIVNGPVITAADGSEVIPYGNNAYWVGDGGWPVDELTITGGEDYTAKTGMRPKFGFFVDENNLPQVTVTNAKSTDISELPHALDITVTAEHDWEDEGEVTKEPTATEDGEKTYKCKHFDTCGGTKTEPIDKLITVTLIPSTMDGSEIGDPVVLTIPKGDSLDSYLSPDDRYAELVEQFENMNEGYYPLWGYVLVTDKPYSEYTSESDVDDADEELFYKALTENTTFYVPMDKFIEELDVTVERPMAGTEVAVQTDDGHVQDGAKGLPTTTISDDKVAKHYELPYWVTDDITKNDYDKPFNGTIQARKDYKVLIQLEPKLGWAFKKLDDPAYATINGKAVDTVLYSDHYYRDILGKVPSDFTYNLFVQGVHVTDSNKDDVLGDGTVKFDPEAVKLTLNNANIEISRREDGDDGNEYGIRSNLGDGIAEFRDKPLTIELIGTNTISDGTNDEGTSKKYGIFVASSGPVTYTGSGTLNVNMKDANTAERYLGLEHHQSITVEGVDINIDIDGTSNGINGIYMLYTNTLKLMNGANVTIDVAKGYAFDNDVHTNNNDLDVTEGCTFEA